jgi:hypothetical protein
MSGNLRFVPLGSPPGKHDHVDILLAQQILAFRRPTPLWTCSLAADGEPPPALLTVMGISRWRRRIYV